MSGFCKDCRHWDDGPEMPGGWGYCRLADGWDGKAYEKTRAFASGKGTAMLVTASDFGCNQFSKRPDDRE